MLNVVAFLSFFTIIEAVLKVVTEYKAGREFEEKTVRTAITELETKVSKILDLLENRGANGMGNATLERQLLSLLPLTSEEGINNMESLLNNHANNDSLVTKNLFLNHVMACIQGVLNN